MLRFLPLLNSLKKKVCRNSYFLNLHNQTQKLLHTDIESAIKDVESPQCISPSQQYPTIVTTPHIHAEQKREEKNEKKIAAWLAIT